MEEMSGFLYFFIIVILLIVVACYAAVAIFLTRFSKKVYGESSVMAWIPIANIYLLGKLTYSKDAGYGLVALLILSCTLTLTIDKTTITLYLPHTLQIILGAVFAGTFVATLIFGIKKYGNLKNSNGNKEIKKSKETEEIAKANDAFFNN